MSYIDQLPFVLIDQFPHRLALTESNFKNEMAAGAKKARRVIQPATDHVESVDTTSERGQMYLPPPSVDVHRRPRW